MLRENFTRMFPVLIEDFYLVTHVDVLWIIPRETLLDNLPEIKRHLTNVVRGSL